MALPTLTTRFESNLLLAPGSEYVFGTCMLGSAFGQVKSATCKRTADFESVLKCDGGLKAFLIKNPRFELQLETLYDSDVAAPTFGDTVTFPVGSITGYVSGEIEIKWDENGGRMLSFPATSWDTAQTLSLYYYDLSGNDWANFSA